MNRMVKTTQSPSTPVAKQGLNSALANKMQVEAPKEGALAWIRRQSAARRSPVLFATL